jgi:hypothetical protein
MYANNAAGAIQYEGWATSSINPQPNQPVWAIKFYHVRRQWQADSGAMGWRLVPADERLGQRVDAVQLAVAAADRNWRPSVPVNKICKLLETKGL